MFSHSHQWIWSTQSLESNSHAGFMFSHSDSVCSHWKETHRLNTCSTTFISGFDLQTWRNNSLPGCIFRHSHQWFWSTGETHFLDPCSAILIRGFDILKHQRDSLSRWMSSHSCQWFCFCSNMREAHHLDVYSTILISSSDLLKHRRATHSLDGGVQPFSSVVLISLNTVEGHTPWWTFSHLFSSQFWFA